MTISALDAEMSPLDVCIWRGNVGDRAVIRCDDIGARCGDVGVTGGIGDCGVGVTPQMCNGVTNYKDMGTFSRPVLKHCETP